MTPIRLSKSTVGEAEAQAVAAAVRAGYLGMGTEVAQFEQELAAYLGGGRHVMCVNTGTSAVHLAVQACELGPEAEVLVPTLTFVASFQAVSASGATPVACDVRAEDGMIDLIDAARRLTPHTRAIMPVHYASGSHGLPEVYAFAQTHGLRVIEDAAHAFGCAVEGRKVGAAGELVCFSFDGIKNITSAEGGAVVTSDPELAERIKNARLLGVEKDTEKRYAGQRSWEFEVSRQGWRYHMSNLNAALGRVQLARLDSDFAPRRVHLARRYTQLLAGLPGLRWLDLDYGPVVPHIFPVYIGGDRRDMVRAALTEQKIESGIHYKPNHLLRLYHRPGAEFPVAEELYRQTLSLPLHAELSDEEQDRVVAVLRSQLS